MGRGARFFLGGVLASALVVVGCAKGPSRGAALEAIRASIKEDGSCTLPLGVLSQLKIQHLTQGICVPKEGAENARACIDALVTAGITRRKKDDYMRAWPDEVSTASLSDVPAYERRSRNLIFGICVELAGHLREGRFDCADARAEKVLRVAPTDETHAAVTYSRDLGLRPWLPAVDVACGTASRPPREATVAFVKSDSGWILSPGPFSGP